VSAESINTTGRATSKPGGPHGGREGKRFLGSKVVTNRTYTIGGNALRIAFGPASQIREKEMSPNKTIMTTFVIGLLFAGTSNLAAKDITATDFSNSRSYSSAVSTEGGKIVWLAGEAVLRDENGKSLAGDFEGQTRAIFASIEKTLAQHQGKLSDIVYMTVYITDARYGDKFVEIRKEIFKQNFPASTLVTVSGLAHPSLLIEITPVAVVGGK
jgi:2-iminobutanoate/2-iminopropanoate deaminase